MKVLAKLLDDPALCTLLACTSLGVSAFTTILHSRTLACAAHSTKSLVRVGQVHSCRICWRAASLKDPDRLGFCWPFQSLHAHLPEPQIPPCRPPPLQSAPMLSAARLSPFQRSLCPLCACFFCRLARTWMMTDPLILPSRREHPQQSVDKDVELLRGRDASLRYTCIKRDCCTFCVVWSQTDGCAVVNLLQ